MGISRFYFPIFLTAAFFTNTLYISATSSEKKSTIKILVGSPIRKSPQILKEFLFSLTKLQHQNITFDYFFIDDNDHQESSALLQKFSQTVQTSCFIHKPEPAGIDYVCNEATHQWDAKDILVWRVAAFKNLIIKTALRENYDYLFFIDSDLVLNPKTVEHLVATEKDIISEIFWTRWLPEQQELPQVWISDTYTLTKEFIEQLRTPGVYEVGGLGACTLISKKALIAGVNFNKIKNLTFWGEDRHFCIRAGALDIPLYVDTHFPAYHIYRESALAGVEEYKKNNNLFDDEVTPKKHKLTLSMCIKNESKNYLRAALESARKYIDEAVIIDDASTDDSVKICQEVLKGIPVHIIHNETSKFTNEIELRQQQWNETIKTNPEWILNLDADEIFEEKCKDEIRGLLDQEEFDVFCFRLYDFWDDCHYREDTYWCAHNYYRPFLLRYKNDFQYEWKSQALHCGRFPLNIGKLRCAGSTLRLKHFGWANKNRRIEKYARYKQLDPDAKFGIKEQYDSILDENPTLIKWVE